MAIKRNAWLSATIVAAEILLGLLALASSLVLDQLDLAQLQFLSVVAAAALIGGLLYWSFSNPLSVVDRHRLH